MAALQVSDVAMEKTGAATVLVRNGKTDAEGSGAVLHLARDSVAIVHEWLVRSSTRLRIPFFIQLVPQIPEPVESSMGWCTDRLPKFLPSDTCHADRFDSHSVCPFTDIATVLFGASNFHLMDSRAS